MYKIKDKYKKIQLTHYLADEFKGKKTISLNSATQEELEHLYEEIGAKTHIQKVSSTFEKEIDSEKSDENKPKRGRPFKK